jgi:hypothetical protein
MTTNDEPQPISDVDSPARRGYPRRGGERQDRRFESGPSPTPADEPQFTSHGLGQPMCTEWQEMSAPVGPVMLMAGPNGWMEFAEVDGRQQWRMWRPFDWNLGG